MVRRRSLADIDRSGDGLRSGFCISGGELAWKSVMAISAGENYSIWSVVTRPYDVTSAPTHAEDADIGT